MLFKQLFFIMFKIKKSLPTSRLYSKTLPDEVTNGKEVFLLEQQAKDKLHQLSILNNDSFISSHFTSWLNQGTKAKDKIQTVRSDIKLSEATNRLSRKSGVSIKRETFSFLKKKKYERECQFKKSVKNAVKQSRTKNSCIAINFEIPRHSSFHQDRIHSYSVRIHPQMDKAPHENNDFSQTEPLVDSTFYHEDKKRKKHDSRLSQSNKKFKKLQSSLLAHKKRSSFWSPLNLKLEREKNERDTSLSNALGVLNSLLQFEKQKICLPVKPAFIRNKFRGTLRRKDMLITK